MSPDLTNFLKKFSFQHSQDGVGMDGSSTAIGQSYIYEVAEPAATPAAKKSSNKNTQNSQSRGLESVFAEGLIIDGSVTSESSISIHGTIRGNVICAGDVNVRGDIEGDVKCMNISMDSSRIIGNVNAECVVILSQGSSINGNIQSASAEINGTLVGDVSVSETVAIKHNAEITGNITAASIAIAEGAVINGHIEITEK